MKQVFEVEISNLSTKEEIGLEVLVGAEIVAMLLGEAVGNFPDEDYHEDSEGKIPALDKSQLVAILTWTFIEQSINAVKAVRDKPTSKFRAFCVGYELA